MEKTFNKLDIDGNFLIPRKSMYKHLWITSHLTVKYWTFFQKASKKEMDLLEVLDGEI